jgi:hypothetical protein
MYKIRFLTLCHVISIRAGSDLARNRYVLFSCYRMIPIATICGLFRAVVGETNFYEMTAVKPVF